MLPPTKRPKLRMHSVRKQRKGWSKALNGNQNYFEKYAEDLVDQKRVKKILTGSSMQKCVFNIGFFLIISKKLISPATAPPPK